MRLTVLVMMAALAIPSCAETDSKAEVFSDQAVTSQLTALLQAAKGSGSGGATLGDYKSHAIKLSVRVASGGAEVHAHFDDIFFVTGGKSRADHRRQRRKSEDRQRWRNEGKQY